MQINGKDIKIGIIDENGDFKEIGPAVNVELDANDEANIEEYFNFGRPYSFSMSGRLMARDLVLFSPMLARHFKRVTLPDHIPFGGVEK